MARIKTFWAVRTREEWGNGDSVRIFRSKPTRFAQDSWCTERDRGGGLICHAAFVAITGIRPPHDEPVELAFTVEKA
jgi:hypothetical protein